MAVRCFIDGSILIFAVVNDRLTGCQRLPYLMTVIRPPFGTTAYCSSRPARRYTLYRHYTDIIPIYFVPRVMCLTSTSYQYWYSYGRTDRGYNRLYPYIGFLQSVVPLYRGLTIDYTPISGPHNRFYPYMKPPQSIIPLYQAPTIDYTPISGPYNRLYPYIRPPQSIIPLYQAPTFDYTPIPGPHNRLYPYFRLPQSIIPICEAHAIDYTDM